MSESVEERSKEEEGMGTLQNVSCVSENRRTDLKSDGSVKSGPETTKAYDLLSLIKAQVTKN
jgi:hypothetical protein